MLTAAKISLTILRKSCRRKHSWRNISRSNVIHNITNNSPSNILQNQFQFQSYCQKYCRSRQQFLNELLSMNGLNPLTLERLWKSSTPAFSWKSRSSMRNITVIYGEKLMIKLWSHVICKFEIKKIFGPSIYINYDVYLSKSNIYMSF